MDAALYRAANRFADRTGFAHGLFRFYAKDGIALFAVLLLAGWWLGRTSTEPAHGVATAVWAGAGPMVALALNQLIQTWVDRARPYDSIPNMHVLIDRTKDFTFASDHATVVGAVAAGLWFVDRRLGIVAWIGALLMAFSRVYVGAHYPGDVVAGLALGAIVVTALRRPAVWAIGWVTSRLAQSPLRPLVVKGD